ncbi:unnamed protein product [Rotaria sordida]|uniref:TTF-type domain-containing protein n=1 Tax=Rotaria sordida TaxID=392033 RepID=A0A815DXJ8_9BILA|nr:unnamed protein product [Rotaria sordida]CAF1575347.1 unnamed protein product [Rotaria sordida]
MSNNKRKTLDFYFSSTQKKHNSSHEQSNDADNQNVVLQSFDSQPSRVIDNEPVKISLINTHENISNENQQNVQYEEEINNETTGDTIDISRSCENPPAQPKLISYPKNHENRSFMSKWYEGRPWLEYSIEKNSTYCYYCRHFGAPTSSSNKKPQTDAFINNGFKNWKKALDKSKGFDQHLKSLGHILATSNYTLYQQRKQSQSNVINMIDKGRIEQIRRNRLRLIKIASALLLCSRQAIGIRGHDERESSSNKGNFIEILKWASSTDPIVKSIFEDITGNSTYLSPIIQNELIKIMADQVRRQITEKIKGKMFALLADESRDSGGNEQLSIVIRVVVPTNDNKDIIQEYFIGLIRLHEFDAQSLSKMIADYLIKYGIELQSCIAQCYDGASVMSGKCAGVQTILRQSHMPQGIYIHCHAHRLNLVIVDVSKVIKYINEFYQIISKVHSYFISSSVTNEYYQQAQEKLALATSSKLKTWSDIRWDSRWSSVNAIMLNYESIVVALNDLIEEGDHRCIDARGILSAIQEPLFIVTMVILNKLFGSIKVLSDQLKSESLDYAESQFLILSVIDQLQNERNDTSFKSIYSAVLDFANKHGIDMNRKSKHRRSNTIPTRFKDAFITSTMGHRKEFLTEADYYENIYFPLIDAILVEMRDRFSPSNLAVLSSVSSMSPQSKSFLNYDQLLPLASHINCDQNHLFNELQVLQPMLQNKKLSNVNELYHEMIPLQEAFSNMMLMIKAAMTIPVSSCTLRIKQVNRPATYDEIQASPAMKSLPPEVTNEETEMIRNVIANIPIIPDDY